MPSRGILAPLELPGDPLQLPGDLLPPLALPRLPRTCPEGTFLPGGDVRQRTCHLAWRFFGSSLGVSLSSAMICSEHKVCVE